MYELSDRLIIAKRISELRSLGNITQEKMAELIDVSYSTYLKIEHGSQNLTIKHLVNIAKVLKVSTDMLLFGCSADEKYGFDDYIKTAKFFSDSSIKDMQTIFKNISKLKNE